MSSSTGLCQEEEIGTPALPIWEQFRRRPEASSSAGSAINAGILSQHLQPFPEVSGTVSSAVCSLAMQKASAPQDPSLTFSDRPIMARPRQAFLPLASQSVVNDNTHVPKLSKMPDLMAKRLKLAYLGDSNVTVTNEHTNGKSHADGQENMSQESVSIKVSDAFHLVYNNKDYPSSSPETDKKSFCLKHFCHDTCNATAKASESLKPTPSPYSNNTSPSNTVPHPSSGISPSNKQPEKPTGNVPTAATNNDSTTATRFPYFEYKQLQVSNKTPTASGTQTPAPRIEQVDITSSPDRLGLAIKRMHEKTKKKKKQQTDKAVLPPPAAAAIEQTKMPIRSKKPETSSGAETQRPRANTAPRSPYAIPELQDQHSPYATPSPHARDLATLCALLPAPRPITQSATQHARPPPLDINRPSTYTPGFAPMTVSERDLEAEVEVEAETEAEGKEKWDDVEISDDEGWEKVCELEDLDWEVVAPGRLLRRGDR